MLLCNMKCIFLAFEVVTMFHELYLIEGSLAMYKILILCVYVVIRSVK